MGFREIREKEALIDELMSSYEDASKIVSAFAEQAEKTREEAKVLPTPKVKLLQIKIYDLCINQTLGHTIFNGHKIFQKRSTRFPAASKTRRRTIVCTHGSKTMV